MYVVHPQGGMHMYSQTYGNWCFLKNNWPQVNNKCLVMETFCRNFPIKISWNIFLSLFSS